MSAVALGTAAATAIGVGTAGAATAGAVAGGAVALGSAALGAVGAAKSSSAAKKAGQTQYDAAKAAGATDAEAARQANEIATQVYQQDLARQEQLYNQATGRLAPYAAAGKGAINQLSSLMAPPTPAHGAIAATAATGTDPATLARLKAAQTAANAKREAFNQRFEQRHAAVGWDQAQAEMGGEMKAIDAEQQAANQAVMKAKKYTPGTAAQAASAGDQGGLLNRDFSVQDYMNDPTSGGNAPPDLTKNFDQTAWLQGQGKSEADLTRNFDRTGYLANAGMTEADLARKFTANDFQVDPGYQFRLEQGNQGIEHSAAAQGGQLSGATIKALAKYNSDLGSQEYGNAFNRFQGTQQQAGNALGQAQGAFNTDRSNLSGELGNAFNRFGINRNNAAEVYGRAFDRWTGQRTNQFNRLASLAGMGQTAATNQGQWGMQYAGNASQAGQNYSNVVGSNLTGTAQRQGEYMTQGANALAAGQVGSANAFNQGLGQVGNSLMQYAYLRQPTAYGGYNNYGNGYNNPSSGGGQYGVLNTRFN